MINKGEYKTIYNECYIRTWYKTEQRCKVEGCTGILKVIDESGLDRRFIDYYGTGQRIEVTYKWGEKWSILEYLM